MASVITGHFDASIEISLGEAGHYRRGYGFAQWSSCWSCFLGRMYFEDGKEASLVGKVRGV